MTFISCAFSLYNNLLDEVWLVVSSKPKEVLVFCYKEKERRIGTSVKQEEFQVGTWNTQFFDSTIKTLMEKPRN